VAIGGDGFFVVQKDGVMSFTRAGNFTKAKDGTLSTAGGEQVMGYPSVNGVITQAAGLAPVQVGSGYFSPPFATTQVKLATNLDANAAVGDSYPTPVTVYDSLGQSHVLTFTFTKTGSATWSYDISIPGAEVGSANATASIGNGNLKFDGLGNLTTPASDVTGLSIPTFADGANALSFDWTLFSGSASSLTQVASPSSTSDTAQDGYTSGSLESFSIGSDGVVEGTFSNGKSMALAQLVLANFPNAQGLVRKGDNNFQATLASGAPAIGAPGTGGRGSLSGGSLELSNVDIASEFAQLITAQRAFQANARTITTFDEITQDTINLKR
jgi:flagellar hook protein FlgE